MQEKRYSSKKEPTLKEQGFYHSPAWRKIRKQALQRDHYLCQFCLKKKKITPATEVHHIKELEDYPELALELSNLTSLCWRCHEGTKHKGSRTALPAGVRIIKVSDGREAEEAAEGTEEAEKPQHGGNP